MVLIMGTHRLRPGTGKGTPRVSVVIAARNEENNIGACLDTLIHQTYPAALYEIIVVNDRSEDRTPEIINGYAVHYPQIKPVHIRTLEPGMAPKKWALQQGISIASGDIILTTDADCRPRSGWISAMTACFDAQVALVAGYSPLTHQSSRSLLHRFIALEALGLVSVTAGSFGINHPLTCSGRNLAYRKAVFEEMGGFARIGHFISGDDDLFLHLIRKNTTYRFRFCIAPDAVVPSIPSASFQEFSNQRTRHASKGLHYDPGLKLGLIAVYLFNVLLLSTFFLPALRPWAVITLGLKSSLEFMLLFRVARLFSQTALLLFFPAAVLLHIPYVVLFGLRGQIGKFRWKDSRYARKIKQAASS